MNSMLKENFFVNFLRKASLEELFQLVNILKGEMSFIGPRPLMLEYLNYYTQEELRRHSVNLVYWMGLSK